MKLLAILRKSPVFWYLLSLWFTFLTCWNLDSGYKAFTAMWEGHIVLGILLWCITFSLAFCTVYLTYRCIVRGLQSMEKSEES